MTRRCRVWFSIKPPRKFTAKETYQKQKITPLYKDDELTGFQVDVEINESEPIETAEKVAKKEIVPLIERIRYLTGIFFEEQLKGIKQINPPEETGYSYAEINFNATIARPCDMPKESELDSQDDDTTYQLCVYNQALDSGNLTEQIRLFYFVLEREERIHNYTIGQDLMLTRHAVSHDQVDRLKSKQFLMSKIGSNSIDFNNPEHVRFLRSMVPKFQQAAKKILDKKI